MLPRLPGLKKVIFTRRVILFHETFAPLGGAQNRCHMARGNCGVAMKKTSLVHTPKLSTIYRDYEHFVFWADNCAAQNKNWTLFSALLYEVNQSSNNCQSVTMKYFEKGAYVLGSGFIPQSRRRRGCGRKNVCMISMISSPLSTRREHRTKWIIPIHEGGK